MQRKNENSQAVSGVVGEMLMIAIVLIIVAVFTSQLSSYLPSERSPTVTIMMSNDTFGNVTLWHKGGDWVKVSSLKVVVSNRTQTTNYAIHDPSHPPVVVPATQVFDLGSNITIDHGQPLTGDERVVVATDRAVIFSGSVGSGGS